MTTVPARIYILRGGLVGPDGPLVSPGMDALGRSIEKAVNVAPKVYNWSDWALVADDIKHADAATKVIVIGFSGGGTRAIYVCNDVAPRRIELLVLYDPSPVWQMQHIKNNVKKAICYYNRSPWMGGLGGGRLEGPQVTEVMISEQHMLVQSDSNLHARTIKEVKQALGLT